MYFACSIVSFMPFIYPYNENMFGPVYSRYSECHTFIILLLWNISGWFFFCVCFPRLHTSCLFRFSVHPMDSSPLLTRLAELCCDLCHVFVASLHVVVCSVCPCLVGQSEERIGVAIYGAVMNLLHSFCFLCLSSFTLSD